MPSDDPILAMVGRPGGPLADTALWELSVVDVEQITEDYRRVTFTGPELARLRYRPGQDLMLRIPGAQDRPTNRRYTIRSADQPAATVVVDMVIHGDGPGARWAASATRGMPLTAIGPRGAIVVDEAADWHLFIGDDTAVPAMAAMAESLQSGTPGIFIAEVSRHAPGLDPELRADQDIRPIWLERGDSEPGSADRLLATAGQVALPPGNGHAYIAGEMSVVRVIAAALAERGLNGPSVSPKAYWRRNGANASHGEPLDPDRGGRADPPTNAAGPSSPAGNEGTRS